MHRVVIDTSVIVSSLRSASGASNAIMRLVASQRIVALATIALFLEYEEVLKRPEQRLAHGLRVDEIDRFLAALASACEPVEIRFQWRPQLSDADDEIVLDAAVNGRADAIVTHNLRDFRQAGKRFGLRVLLPGELLKETRS
jgi:putative PIN family toxin of toxin-antitoxin system